MEDLYSYTDYQAWLRDAAEDLKQRKPIASWRFIGNRLGVDPGNLLRVAQGKVHLSLRLIEPVAEFFKLDERQKSYFEEMVLFGRSRNDKEAWDHFQKMQAIKGVRFRNLQEREFEFYQKWYHGAVRSLISIYPFSGDYAQLGRMVSPSISPEQSQASVELMRDLGFLREDEQGFWHVTDQFLSTGARWKSGAVRAYQSTTMDLAKESLERHHPDLRDISTVTMTLNRADLPSLKDRIRQFREELLRFSAEGKGDDGVFQLNIQVFPVGLLSQGEEQ